MLAAQHLHMTHIPWVMKTSRATEVQAALGKAGAYEFAWNVSRRVAQVCWPAATAAKARGSVLTSMVAEVRSDDGS
jgi:hypothetical protein